MTPSTSLAAENSTDGLLRTGVARLEVQKEERVPVAAGGVTIGLVAPREARAQAVMEAGATIGQVAPREEKARVV